MSQRVSPGSVTGESHSVASNFIKVSIIYFLIGAFWMGFGQFIPAPQTDAALEPYMWAEVHVMVLGWATLAIMGALYYLVPRIAGRVDMFSSKLGRIHFWVTNITFPIGVLLVAYGSFAIDTLVAKGDTFEQATRDPSILPILLGYLIIFSIGYAVQFVFAYNVYKTLATKVST